MPETIKLQEEKIEKKLVEQEQEQIYQIKKHRKNKQSTDWTATDVMGETICK